MSAIGRRMNHLKYLMDLRNGPGAAILPRTVKKIHLEFAHKCDKGHMGPRRFWHEYLRSLKYHNPSIPMIVNRTRDQTVIPRLTIYVTRDHAPLTAEEGQASPLKLEAPATKEAIQTPKKAVAVVRSATWEHIGSSTEGTSPAPEPEEGETAVKIRVKGMTKTDIWKRFMAKTGATPVEPTAEDVDEMERLAVLRAQADVDRLIQKAYRDKQKAEKHMLERARQEADAIKDE